MTNPKIYSLVETRRVQIREPYQWKGYEVTVYMVYAVSSDGTGYRYFQESYRRGGEWAYSLEHGLCQWNDNPLMQYLSKGE